MRYPASILLFILAGVILLCACNNKSSGSNYFVGNYPPTVSITRGPSGATSDNKPFFGYSGSDTDGTIDGYWVSIDVNPPDIWTTLTTWTPPSLAEGQHTFYVQAEDNNGTKSSVASRIFTVKSTLSVPTDYTTIQEAIDAAGQNSTVLVANGTYTGLGNKDLDFRGKDIVLKSTNGAANCIIDCQNSGRGFYFHSGETNAAVVEGFTIRNGNKVGGVIYTENAGGGIYCSNAGPTINNCILSNNNAGDKGGGIYADNNSNILITNCSITGNTAAVGGGIAGRYCSINITNCTISYNNAEYNYGGISLKGVNNSVIDNCTISNNTANTGAYDSCFGGGIGCIDSSPTISNCNITHNTVNGGSDISAGGICCAGSPAIINCNISYNSVTGTRSVGGGISLESGNPIVTNCVITNNSANYGGGIVSYLSANPTITNCTIADNIVIGGEYGSGGGIYCSSSSPVLNNTILWGNGTTLDSNQIYTRYNDDTVTLNYCNYANETGDIAGYGVVTVNTCLITNPLFVDSANDNYRLQDLSPCIDAGSNVYIPVGIDIDADGNPRIRNNYVDIGAYEHQAGSQQLAITTTSLPDGTVTESYSITLTANGGTPPYTWVKSSGQLPPGLSISGDGNISGVPTAEGEYSFTVQVTDSSTPSQTDSENLTITVTAGALPTLFVDGTNGNDSNDGTSWGDAVLTISTAVNIAVNGDVIAVGAGTYTGSDNTDLDFNGKSIAIKSHMGPDNTTIGCGGSGRGFHFHSGEGNSCVLDGFTIMNGAPGSVPTEKIGGAICCENSSPTIMNCKIISNAACYGGGIYCYDASPVIVDCTIMSNLADRGLDGSGGGVYCGGNSNPDITNCLIEDNYAFLYGGGIYATDSSDVTVNGCTISNHNSAGGGGGGIYCDGDSAVFIDGNTVIDSNGAPTGGGIYSGGNSVLEVANSTISNNTADKAAGIFCVGNNGLIDNCIISSNAAYGEGGGIFCGALSMVITKSTISGNSSEDNGGGIYCKSSNTDITNCIFKNNTANVATYGSGGALYCDTSDPTLINCLITANSAKYYGGGICCEEGSPTLINCTAADNSSQYRGGGIYSYMGSDPVAYNSIFWGNSATSSGNQAYIADVLSSLTLEYCDIANGSSDIVNAGGALYEDSNKYVNPQFINAAGDNYRLDSGSPCIDTASNSLLPVNITEDLDGNSRLVNGVVDMGAYEDQ